MADGLAFLCECDSVCYETIPIDIATVQRIRSEYPSPAYAVVLQGHVAPGERVVSTRETAGGTYYAVVAA